MPELPEVETIRRGLAPVLEGRTITRVELRRRDLRIPFPPDFSERLTGARIAALDRRAKYILIRCEDGLVWVIHLGMSGRITVAAPGANGPEPSRHDHVVVWVSTGERLIYTDPRRFGLMTLIPGPELETHALFRDLGPEPMSGDFDGASLSRALAGRKTSIKAALLDQRTVVGVGNIYACEALFRARLSPRRKAYTVPGRRAARLADCVKEVLGEAISAGGSSLRDYARVDGELGYFQHSLAVYGREGEPCPGCDCGAAIRRIVQSNRSTFFCARRQR